MEIAIIVLILFTVCDGATASDKMEYMRNTNGYQHITEHPATTTCNVYPLDSSNAFFDGITGRNPSFQQSPLMKIFQGIHRPKKTQAAVKKMNNTKDKIPWDSRYFVKCDDNTMTHIPKALPVPDAAVAVMDINENSIRQLPGNVFSRFTRMIYLSILSNPVLKIDGSVFSGLSKVEALVISLCPFRYYRIILTDPRRLFKPLKNLKYLDLSGTCFSLDDMLMSFFNVSATLDTLILNNVFSWTLTKSIWILESDFSDRFSHTRLTRLSLESNLIAVIKQNAFRHFRSLTYLSLRRNQIIGDRAFLFDILSMTRLEYFDFGCQASHDPAKCMRPVSTGTSHDIPRFESKDNHSDVNAQKASQYKNETVLELPTFINLQQIRRSHDNDKYDGGLTGLLPNLKTLKLDHMNQFAIKIHFSEICIVGNHLETLDASFSAISGLYGSMRCMPYLKYVNMNGIPAEYLDPHLFKNLLALETLLLSSCVPVCKVFETDKAAEAFHGNPNLKRLSLAGNNLYRLPDGIFAMSNRLEHLDLSKNKFRVITTSFRNLSSLKSLNLSHNLFRALSTSFMYDLLQVLQRSGSAALAVDLRSNPFFCSCADIRLLSSMWNSKISFLGYKNDLTCTLTNGSVISMEKATAYLLRECASLSPEDMATWFFLFPLSLIVTTLGSLSYRYRWRLRYVWYMTVHHLHERDQTRNQNFVFDAFVSYNSRDTWWVYDELLPRLGSDRTPELFMLLDEQAQDHNIHHKGDGKYLFCINERDFIPGRAIADNITNAVTKSRNTILFVTRNFVRSGWCDFEANLAHAHHLSSHRRGIIAVVHPNVLTMRRRNMPVTLDALLDTVTYLEWPPEGEARDVFWLRLQSALGKPVH